MYVQHLSVFRLAVCDGEKAFHVFSKEFNFVFRAVLTKSGFNVFVILATDQSVSVSVYIVCLNKSAVNWKL
jgi:hypothetical protein